MSQTTANLITATLVRIIRPLVRVLLRFGIPYRNAAETLKWCYANVAMNEFELPGKRQTKSRVAVITGLTRVDVDHLLRLPPPHAREIELKYNRAARVLSGWAEDPAYSNGNGQPADLAVDGEKPSFASLVYDYSGGTTLRAVLDEVLRVGAAVQLEDGKIRLNKVDFIATDGADQSLQIAILGQAGGDLISTIEHNIRPDQPDRWLQMFVQQRGLPERCIPEVRRYVREHAHRVIDDLDRYLTRLARENPAHADEPVCDRLGVGFYYFQDDQAEAAALPTASDSTGDLDPASH